MFRERALKIALVVVGLLFTAGVVPLTMFFSREPSVPMLMSIYVTLGIFLLLAVRDPEANRSLIAFGGWANLAHAGVMAAQEYRNVIERRELAGVIVFAMGHCTNLKYFDVTKKMYAEQQMLGEHGDNSGQVDSKAA